MSGDGQDEEAATLSGRPVESAQLQAILNYQDQGSGAEIALGATAALPGWLADALAGFVHDELIFEVAADRAEAPRAEIERVMIEAADRLLQPFGLRAAVEIQIGEAWTH